MTRLTRARRRGAPSRARVDSLTTVAADENDDGDGIGGGDDYEPGATVVVKTERL